MHQLAALLRSGDMSHSLVSVLRSATGLTQRFVCLLRDGPLPRAVTICEAGALSGSRGAHGDQTALDPKRRTQFPCARVCGRVFVCVCVCLCLCVCVCLPALRHAQCVRPGCAWYIPNLQVFGLRIKGLFVFSCSDFAIDLSHMKYYRHWDHSLLPPNHSQGHDSGGAAMP